MIFPLRIGLAHSDKFFSLGNFTDLGCYRLKLPFSLLILN